MEQCKNCKRWLYRTDCICKPFEVCVNEWDEGEFYKQYAVDAEEAAEKYVQGMDECEHDVLNSSVSVTVRSMPNGLWSQEFMVYAEAVVEYTAREVSPKQSEPGE